MTELRIVVLKGLSRVKQKGADRAPRYALLDQDKVDKHAYFGLELPPRGAGFIRTW